MNTIWNTALDSKFHVEWTSLGRQMDIVWSYLLLLLIVNAMNQCIIKKRKRKKGKEKVTIWPLILFDLTSPLQAEALVM